MPPRSATREFTQRLHDARPEVDLLYFGGVAGATTAVMGLWYTFAGQPDETVPEFLFRAAIGVDVRVVQETSRGLPELVDRLDRILELAEPKLGAWEP